MNCIPESPTWSGGECLAWTGSVVGTLKSKISDSHSR